MIILTTFLGFAGFAIFPNILINVFKDEKYEIFLQTLAYVASVLFMCIMAIVTEKVIWIWGMLLGFFLTVCLGVILARVANAIYRDDQEESEND